MRNRQSVPHYQSLPRRFWKQIDLQSMVLPSIALILLFNYVPMFGIVMAFQNFQIGDVPGFSQFVGLEHFKVLFSEPNLGRVMRNTLVMSFMRIIIGFPIPIVLALLFNEISYRRYKKVMQTISYMPHFLSWVVVAALMFEMLAPDGGAINQLLLSLGIIEKPILFMGDSKYFYWLVLYSDIWKESGWSAIIYAAAIAGIDQDMYEAADIDGVTMMKRIWYITLPAIRSTIVILFIMAVSGLLNSNFEQIMMMTGNLNNRSVAETADVLDTYIYSYGVRQARFSFATAAGLVKSIVAVALLAGANGLCRKFAEESLW